MTIIDDISQVRAKAVQTLIDQSIQKAMNAHYGITHSICEGTDNSLCIYLLLYGLDSFAINESFNFLSEAQIINIITKLQELTQY